MGTKACDRWRPIDGRPQCRRASISSSDGVNIKLVMLVPSWRPAARLVLATGRHRAAASCRPASTPAGSITAGEGGTAFRAGEGPRVPARPIQPRSGDKRRRPCCRWPYYPPSLPPYRRAGASSRPSTERVTVLEMPTSTGQRRKMRHVGTLEFSVQGEALTLAAFVEEGSTDLNRLFVPFIDSTSGTRDVSGRPLPRPRSHARPGIYLIDFNHAYNPVLLLQSRPRLSLSARANRLQVPIRAGEKVK